MPTTTNAAPVSIPRLLADLALLATSGAALVALGDRLPAGHSAPLSHQDPALVVATGLRLVALLAVGYLISLHLLGLALRALDRGERCAAAFPTWLGRRAFERVVGIGAATTVGLSLVGGAAGAAEGSGPTHGTEAGSSDGTEAPPPGADVVVMVPLDGPAPERASSTPPLRSGGSPPVIEAREGRSGDPSEPAAGPSVATMVAVAVPVAEDDPTEVDETAPPGPASAEPGADGTTGLADATPSPTTPPTGTPAEDVATSTAAGAGAVHEVGEDHWEVALGDHLWAIAAEVLTDAGRPTDDEGVAAYWTVLIDANLDSLVDPDDPDLLIPGQRLVLPNLDVSAGAG